jgi:IS30 family transposase
MEVSAQMALRKVCPTESSVNTGKKKYHPITYEDRVQIEGYVKEGHTPAEIAGLIGCSERSIKRELANTWEEKQSDWTYKTRYTYDYAQMRYEERAAKKGRRGKLKEQPALAAFLEKKIKEDSYSPEAALFAAKNEGMEVDISVKAVYDTIDRKELGEVTRKDLLRKNGWHKEKSKPRKAHHTKGLSIELRPEGANERSEPGHYEMDLIVGKQGTKPVLLTLTDRMTRQEIIRKLPSKEQKSVKAALDKLERQGVKFKTVTSDNGSEFLDFLSLQVSVRGGERFKMYYAHPYSSWERGTNENGNGIVRRFLPKGTDFSRVSHRKVSQIQSWMNNYPRKILNGLSSERFLLRLVN